VPADSGVPTQVEGDVGTFAVVDGIAYAGSPAHDGVVIRLASEALEACAPGQPAQALEVPAAAGTQRASLWACDQETCRTTGHPVAEVTLDAVGNAVGERIVGRVEVVDAIGQSTGSADFDVVYCGIL